MKKSSKHPLRSLDLLRKHNLMPLKMNMCIMMIIIMDIMVVNIIIMINTISNMKKSIMNML